MPAHTKFAGLPLMTGDSGAACNPQGGGTDATMLERLHKQYSIKRKNEKRHNQRQCHERFAVRPVAHHRPPGTGEARHRDRDCEAEHHLTEDKRPARINAHRHNDRAGDNRYKPAQPTAAP